MDATADNVLAFSREPLLSRWARLRGTLLQCLAAFVDARIDVLVYRPHPSKRAKLSLLGKVRSPSWECFHRA